MGWWPACRVWCTRAVSASRARRTWGCEAGDGTSSRGDAGYELQADGLRYGVGARPIEMSRSSTQRNLAVEPTPNKGCWRCWWSLAGREWRLGGSAGGVEHPGSVVDVGGPPLARRSARTRARKGRAPWPAELRGRSSSSGGAAVRACAGGSGVGGSPPTPHGRPARLCLGKCTWCSGGEARPTQITDETSGASWAGRRAPPTRQRRTPALRRPAIARSSAHGRRGAQVGR